MSIELLRGETGYLRFGGYETDIYRELLMLAHKHGWKPMGTSAAEWLQKDGSYRGDPNWNPANYWTNDFQTVEQEDATELANGLERAGPQPDEHTEFLRKEFITFCRGGSFAIG